MMSTETTESESDAESDSEYAVLENADAETLEHVAEGLHADLVDAQRAGDEERADEIREMLSVASSALAGGDSDE